MTTRTHATHTLDQPALTRAFGLALGRLLRAGDVVLLSGDLGAGKTTLVRSIAEGMGLDPKMVSSPTFVVMNQYPSDDASRPGLVHLDAYRAGGDDDDSLGLDRAVPGSVVCIEWPDKLGPTLDRILSLAGTASAARLLLEHTGEQSRRVTLDLPHAWMSREHADRLIDSPPRWCPKTGEPVPPDSRYYPFASERAQLADLNGWFVESYQITRPIEEEDLDTFE